MLWGIIQRKNFFPCKGKKMSEVQLCFPQGTLALRQGTAENTKFLARIREKRTMLPQKWSLMHWSGPVMIHAPVLCSPVFIHCASRSSKLDARGRAPDLSACRKTDPVHSHLFAFSPGWGGRNSKAGFANSVTMHLFGILANLLKSNVNIKECKISQRQHPLPPALARIIYKHLCNTKIPLI